MIMKIKTNILKEFACSKVGDTIDGITLVSSNLNDKSDWSYWTRQVLEYKGNFYKTMFSNGATEEQIESPYDYEPEEMELTQVFPVYEIAYR